MIDRKHKLSLVKQCETLDLTRSGVYYRPKPVSSLDLNLMREIDEIHLERPYFGIRRMADELHEMGYLVNHKRVHRLMRLMRIEAIYPKPFLSKSNPAHKIYPYLLRGLKIDRPNQVWATDITYIPMKKGFAYLTAVMDLFSRRILSWRLSNSLDTSFCIDALEEALYRHGKPEIFNSDQGSQFTSEGFTKVLKTNEIEISMDGKGAWRDNVFVERLWRSVKYEEVYLNAYESMAEAKLRLGRWIDFYNNKRKHQTIKTTPNQKYGNVPKLKLAA